MAKATANKVLAQTLNHMSQPQTLLLTKFDGKQEHLHYYAVTHGEQWLGRSYDRNTLSALGKLATELCAINGYPVMKGAYQDKFGYAVQAYPAHILKQAFLGHPTTAYDTAEYFKNRGKNV